MRVSRPRRRSFDDVSARRPPFPPVLLFFSLIWFDHFCALVPSRPRSLVSLPFDAFRWFFSCSLVSLPFFRLLFRSLEREAALGFGIIKRQ